MKSQPSATMTIYQLRLKTIAAGKVHKRDLNQALRRIRHCPHPLTEREIDHLHEELRNVCDVLSAQKTRQLGSKRDRLERIGQALTRLRRAPAPPKARCFDFLRLRRPDAARFCAMDPNPTYGLWLRTDSIRA